MQGITGFDYAGLARGFAVFWKGTSTILKIQVLSLFLFFLFIHIKVRASDRGRIGVFYAFKMPKTHWR
jgi:hypothetical protein